MLSNKIIQTLNQFNIPATSTKDFISGLKLMQLVSHVFYKGQTQSLLPKLRISDENKTGNNVLNINIILNSIKKNNNIQLPTNIKNLTAFQLIQNEQTMIQLLEWIISQYSKQNNEMSPPRQQQNQFQNLYFVSSLQKKVNLNDSLQQQKQEQKVVPRGSFKMIKPKVGSTGQKSFNNQNSENRSMGHASAKQLKFQESQPLKQLTHHFTNKQINDETEDINIRKTIPKMYQKPPLYRSNKLKQDIESMKINPFKQNLQNDLKSSHIKNKQQTIKDIQFLQNQIQTQQRSMITTNAPTVHLSSSLKRKLQNKQSRSIFKMNIAETDQTKKKSIMEWLININILNMKSSKCIQDLHEICKDGVIFMEICNYYRGRGQQLFYFQTPKRSAQMHSNYQKLFNSVQNIINFSSQLINKYEFFIPEPQPNAFWSLMNSFYTCFYRQNKQKDQKINRYSNQISNKVQGSSKINKMSSDSISYTQIKYNSGSLQKQKFKQQQQNRKPLKTHSSVQGPRKQTPKLIKRQNSQQSQKRSNTGTPYVNQLIQNQEPIQQVYKTERGYKQMYLCKFKNMQTPKKNESMINTSLSRSRVRSNGSAKKLQKRRMIPSINLQMQMKVLAYLKQFAIQQQNVQLFKDPFRNGLLLASIIKKQLNYQCLAMKKPKSIQDCRNNFINGIQAMKLKLRNFNINYQGFIQQYIKGQKSLFYGLIWQFIKQKQQRMNNNKDLSRRQKSSKNTYNQIQQEQQYISWIRMLQKISPEIASLKIRNQSSFFNCITNTDFLYYYSWIITNKKIITSNYPQSLNAIHKQSNLKKIIGFLVQHKIIRSDYLWKTKSLIKKQKNIMNQLVNDLITYYNHLYNKEQLKTINFIKYTRDQSKQNDQKPKQRLETTMANQTSMNYTKIEQPLPKVEINWMRKLGFNGNLDLNNGVILCRLISKLNMKTIQGVKQNPQSRAECLGNIRRAIKNIPKFKWDQFDIVQSNYHTNLQIYTFLRQAYKHCYALKNI